MSYKPGVSDFRESPSLIISEILQKKFNIKTNLFDLKNDQNLKIRKKTKINDKKKHIILVKHNEYLNIHLLFLKHNHLYLQIVVRF